MIKKMMIGVMAAVLVLGLLPIEKSLAAEGDVPLLGGNSMLWERPNFTPNPNYMNLTDNNTSTLMDLLYKQSASYVFEKEYDIFSYNAKFNSTTASGYAYISFYSDKEMTQVIATYNGGGSNVYREINLKNVRAVKVYSTTSSGGYYINTLEVWGQPTTPIIYDEITGITEKTTYNSVELSFDSLYGNKAYAGAKIYRDDVLIKQLERTETTYLDQTVSPSTSYDYKITALYSDGTETTGISKNITTPAPPEPEEVKEVNVKTSYNRVDLSWNLPAQEEFKHVNIYRVETTEEPGILENLFMGTIVSAAAEEDKIFETNGTYFNDLTVKPEKTYEYTLTTQDTFGQESEGVTVEATTTAEPAPKMEGETYEIDQNGDYLFTWDKPTEGTVKIIVGGKEYATTEAINGQFIIPKDDMKITVLGDPDVSLQPISKYGTTGETKSISEENSILKLPFSVNDLVGSSFGLLTIVSSFLLLGLSFILFPKLRGLIVNVFRNIRKGKETNEKERVSRRFRNGESEPREKHEGRDHLEKTDKLKRERQERERGEKETLAETKIKDPIAPKESAREARRAEKAPRTARATKEPRTPRERNKRTREPRRKRRA